MHLVAEGLHAALCLYLAIKTVLFCFYHSHSSCVCVYFFCLCVRS